MTLETRERGKGRKKRKGDFKDATLWALKMKEEATRQGRQTASKS